MRSVAEQADRDALAEVLAGDPRFQGPHLHWDIHTTRVIAEAALASDALAQRDRRVAAEALRKAADEASWPNLGSEPGSGHTSTYSVRHWLRERADQIEAGDQ